MGIETDQKGNIWVAETGTANNDGKVVVVAKNHGTAQAYDAIVNLSSIKNALSGEEEGPAHLLFDHGTLYVLAGDYLYTVNLMNFKPGDAQWTAPNFHLKISEPGFVRKTLLRQRQSSL